MTLTPDLFLLEKKKKIKTIATCRHAAAGKNMNMRKGNGVML